MINCSIYLLFCNAAAAAKSLQSCLTLCHPRDGSPPGSPVPGILQVRTLEWVAISFSNAWKWKVKVKSFSCVRLLATPWTAAYQAPPPMGFSRQEYWSGVPLCNATVCKFPKGIDSDQPLVPITTNTPESGRLPGDENGRPLQCFCLENLLDRVAWWAIVYRVTKNWTWLKQLSMHAFTNWLNSLINLNNEIGKFCVSCYYIIHIQDI